MYKIDHSQFNLVCTDLFLLHFIRILREGSVSVYVNTQWSRNNVGLLYKRARLELEAQSAPLNDVGSR